MEGTCQCGRIAFTAPLPAPQALYICHCTECRHQSSSTYGMTAVFPFFPLSGNISTYTRPNPNGVTKGYFCTNCGSRIYHQHIDKQGTVSDSVSVKAGCLKDLSKEMMRGAVSFGGPGDGANVLTQGSKVHIWTRNAVIDIPEGVETHEEEPPGGSFSKDD